MSKSCWDFVVDFLLWKLSQSRQVKEAAAAANNADTVTALFSSISEKDVRRNLPDAFVYRGKFNEYISVRALLSARGFMLACKQWQVEIWNSV